MHCCRIPKNSLASWDCGHRIHPARLPSAIKCSGLWWAVGPDVPLGLGQVGVGDPGPSCCQVLHEVCWVHRHSLSLSCLSSSVLSFLLGLPSGGFGSPPGAAGPSCSRSSGDLSGSESEMGHWEGSKVGAVPWLRVWDATCPFQGLVVGSSELAWLQA
jgi:hypothetical protein